MTSAHQVRVAPRRKLSAQIAETLRAQLLAGDIAPGQQLPTESKLTESFGVSRTVVREALAALAADGLVEARQGAGVFAANHPASTVGSFAAEMGSRVSAAINVLEVRLAIEVESAALAAARRNPSQLASIQEAFFEFERLLRLGQSTGSADFAFHRAIAAATNNPYYVEMLDALGERAIPCDVATPFSTELAFNPEYQAVLQREHLAILDAIAAGDAAGARDAMRRHLGASLERYGTRLHERTAHYPSAATEEA
ncbi:FadR/GntR family transcriptional regulator [Devosia sp.]|uniref:FadR/GntR family transcriptional regulator n=1 Tax=Devosia sp. TaxID=1871048 RepID=UPI002F24F212